MSFKFKLLHMRCSFWLEKWIDTFVFLPMQKSLTMGTQAQCMESSVFAKSDLSQAAPGTPSRPIMCLTLRTSGSLLLTTSASSNWAVCLSMNTPSASSQWNVPEWVPIFTICFLFIQLVWESSRCGVQARRGNNRKAALLASSMHLERMIYFFLINTYFWFL